MDSFYVTLLSNNISTGGNHISSFQTIFPKRLTLQGEWRVALTEISYPKSWYNLPSQEFMILDQDGHGRAEKAISKGQFNDMQKLMLEVNTKLHNQMKLIAQGAKMSQPYLIYHPNQQKVELIPGVSNGQVYYAYLGDELEQMLGFQALDLDPNSTKIEVSRKLIQLSSDIATRRKGIRCVDLTGGIRNILVYCDIVEETIVGDVQAPLLRTITASNSSDFGQQTHLEFQKLQYIPVVNKEISSIRIDIRDDTGEKIRFESGKVILTLRFSKWKNST